MHTVPRAMRLCCSATFTLLLLHPPLAECSSRNNKQTETLNSIKQQEDYHRKLDIALHGILLWASMGFLMPVGLLIIRMIGTKEFHRTRFKIFYYVHASLQVVSVLLATAAAVISIRKFENSFNNCHQRVGLALYVAIYFQVLCGFRRPKRESNSRRAWYFFHWILGTAICIVGIFNTYTGLKAYHIKMSKSISIWSILFTAQVSFMAFFYLFQDKWDYIQKQGGIRHVVESEQIATSSSSSSLQIIAQGHNNDKEAMPTEPRRKSNSLGTYFSRSTALNKLFQLT